MFAQGLLTFRSRTSPVGHHLCPKFLEWAFKAGYLSPSFIKNKKSKIKSNAPGLTLSYFKLLNCHVLVYYAETTVPFINGTLQKIECRNNFHSEIASKFHKHFKETQNKIEFNLKF